MSAGRGLKRKVVGGVWYVRRAAPGELRPTFGGRRELVERLQTRVPQQAERRRDDVWRRWSGQFAAARREPKRGLDHEAALVVIEVWRRAMCSAACAPEIESIDMFGSDEFVPALGISFDPARQTAVHRKPQDTRTVRSAEATAHAYFERDPEVAGEQGLEAQRYLLGRSRRTSSTRT